MGRYDHYGSGSEIAQRLKDTEGQFNTLNVDMIFNQPGQDQAMLAQDINTLLEIDVGQVSFYPLMMADSTRSRVHREMGNFSYSKEKAMYYQILDSMSPSHPPSSAWCFSRGNNQIDEYLVTHQEFVGVGSGSLSYLNGSLYASSFSIMQYDQLLETQKTGITRIRPLDGREQYFYRMLMSLFGLSLEPSMAASKTAQILRLAGIVDGTIPTRKGMYYVVMAMSQFLSGVNNFRDDMRRSLKQEYDASYGIQPVNLIQLD
jgi:coproporphyrinogen III oxidase-like Fe-S oxidoreductase